MRIKSVFLAFSILLTQQLFSQEIFKRFSLGVGMVKNEYNGDYGNALFNFNTKAYYSNAAFLSFNISTSFDIGVQASKGNYGYYINEINTFEGGKNDAFVYINYKINNKFFLDSDINFFPYLTMAVGIANYYENNGAVPWPTIIKAEKDNITSFGLGFNYKFSKKISIRYEFLYNFTNSDLHDQNRGGEFTPVFGTPIFPGIKKGNDQYGQHFFFIVYHLSNPRDRDEDGTLDKYQKKNQ